MISSFLRTPVNLPQLPHLSHFSFNSILQLIPEKASTRKYLFLIHPVIQNINSKKHLLRQLISPCPAYYKETAHDLRNPESPQKYNSQDHYKARSHTNTSLPAPDLCRTHPVSHKSSSAAPCPPQTSLLISKFFFNLPLTVLKKHLFILLL